MNGKYFVFDFDGVICDSNTECFITSWRAWCDYTGQRYAGNPNFSGQEFLLFKEYRGYIKRGGEYYIFWRTISDGNQISSQAEMDQLTRKWNEKIADYKPHFYDARKKIRDADPVAWLEMHQVYPEASRVFSRFFDEDRVHIATLKDKESVIRILAYHDIEVPADKVLDQFEIRHKLQALDSISEITAQPPENMVFIDDNVTHLLAPKSNGYHVMFADWGYHTPEHIRLAEESGIRRLGLHELAGLAQFQDLRS